MVIETSECIPIKNKGRNYTDCMEFSLLRFSHMLLLDIEEIKKFGYCYNKSNNKYFLEHIKKYPIIYPKIDYYYESKEREDWSINVSDKEFFDYYRNDKAELFTSVRNILIFLREYLDLDVNFENPQETFNKISNSFSNNSKKIEITIDNIKEKIQKLPMKEIKRYLSRPDNEYKNFEDEDFEFIYRITTIKIILNGYEYYWNLTELIIVDERISNKFITGHSVIEEKLI